MNAKGIDINTGIDPDYDMVGHMILYEAGSLTGNEALDLFSFLVKTGQAYTLQGNYGRAATTLIEAGYLDKTGKILREVP